MAVVIPFAPRLRSPAASLRHREQPAQIMFFTGVRYDRAAEAEVARIAAAATVQSSSAQLPSAKRRGTARPRRAKSAGQPA